MYLYNRLLFSKAIEKTTAIHNTMDKSQSLMLSKKKPDIKEYIMYEHCSICINLKNKQK